MTEENIKELVHRSERAALLLGEITGSLSVLSQKVNELVYGSELKEEVEKLFNMVLKRVESIYYDNK
jgi:hypothetical protein